ncbi:flagellar hook capping protein [Paraneptunicella aestuarii]|uniref:flagellar hook assembly protein FlgD n=1 Tax=Paraneptunicella aestuarii TaxID=2831148 RepID=UPI001E5292F9|nr:flagellar hook capping FlgD N-terminal domain-containing protein [Paraneptunicella aestuarii]UAA37586.1 flagellar hook capping protein [Paraneptunicella aestuarii]
MIDAIGGTVVDSGQELSNNAINQEDFIRLFLAQLTNQDPLEPVDNSQFLAQMAQFTSLEQTRLMNESLSNMLTMESSAQGLQLLGQSVQVINGNSLFDGSVEGISFNSSGVHLTVKNSSNEFLTDVALADVRLVQK